MLKFLYNYVVWFLRYVHLNKHTIMKFECEVKTP